MRRSVFVLATVAVLAIGFAPSAGAGVVVDDLVFAASALSAEGTVGIYTMPAAGGAATKLTPDGYGPRWTPDGSGVAYIGRLGAVRWVSADGLTTTTLIPRGALPEGFRRAIGIAYAPDGTRMAVSVSDSSYEQRRLAIVDLATLDATVVSRGSISVDWSSTDRLVVSSPSGIVTMGLGGGHRSLVFPHQSSVPRWSPDGSSIAFTHRVARSGEVYIMGADGSDPTNLTTSDAYEWTPAFSPDGTRIVYSRSRHEWTLGNLYVMNTDGSNVVRITATPDLDEWQPEWRP